MRREVSFHMAFSSWIASENFLKRFAPHVIGFNQFHAADVLNHNRVQCGNGVIGPFHQVIRIAEHHPHYNNSKDQRNQGNQCQRNIDGHQINKDDYRPHQIAHKVRKVMGQKQLQLFNIFIQNRFYVPVRRSFKAPKGALAMCSATMQRTLKRAP